MNDLAEHIKNTLAYCLLFVCMLMLTSCTTESHQQLIAVNLVGYNPDQVKQALLVNTSAVEFKVHRIDKDTMNVVFRDAVGPEQPPDLATGDRVSVLDFTALKTEGEYVILVLSREGKILKSDSFRISKNIYRDVANQSLQSFYYQRCGVRVENDHAWSHEVCHTDDAPFYENPLQKIDVTGGWHDAGAYNKFSLNTAFSAAFLLYLYELNPDSFHDGQLAIPESSNGIPDILDEVSWALHWLLKMQDTGGGVFHKVSQKQWNGEMLPSDENSAPRYIFEISTTATADFSAVTAMAARIFNEFDPVFSAQLKDASLNAWGFLERHPAIQPLGGFVNPPDVFGGEYGDQDDTDERLWAAIELYKFTNDERFLEYFTRHYNQPMSERLPVLSWQNVQVFAYHSFLRAEKPEKYNRIQAELWDYLTWNADAILRKQTKNNYMNLVGHTEYYWGSNSVGLGYAYELIQMYRLSGEGKYQQAALDELHYVLGRNPFGMSMVTGIGSRSVQNPYHQLSKMGGFEEPVPGMLTGGPNNSSYLRKYFMNRVISTYPGKNYEDTFENYLVNEVAINFTAVFLYLAGSQVTNPNTLSSNSYLK